MKHIRQLSYAIILTALSALANPAYADVTCPAAKVKLITPKDGKVFIQLEDQSYHLLGMVGDHKVEDKIAMAVDAQRQNNLVELSFPNGYDASCLSSDTTVMVKKIKVVKKQKYKQQMVNG